MAKKIKSTSNMGVKIIDSIVKHQSQHTWIVGSTTLKGVILKDLFKYGAVPGQIKFLDTQGRITFMNTDSQMNIWNKLIDELMEYMAIDEPADMAELTDDEIKTSIQEFIDEQVQQTDSTYNKLQAIAADNKYVAKLLKSFSKGKKIKKVKVIPKLGLAEPIFTSHLLPELNDTVIIFNNISLPKNVDTDILTNIINDNTQHYNVILVEDKKGGMWKLSKMFDNKFGFVSESKKKIVYKL